MVLVSCLKHIRLRWWTPALTPKRNRSLWDMDRYINYRDRDHQVWLSLLMKYMQVIHLEDTPRLGWDSLLNQGYDVRPDSKSREPSSHFQHNTQETMASEFDCSGTRDFPIPLHHIVHTNNNIHLRVIDAERDRRSKNINGNQIIISQYSRVPQRRLPVPVQRRPRTAPIDPATG